VRGALSQDKPRVGSDQDAGTRGGRKLPKPSKDSRGESEMTMRINRIFNLALLTAFLAASAHAVYMVHEFYLPLPEAQVLQSFRSVDGMNRVRAPLESVTSIVVTGPDTIIHYDHWEDGYETDINNPVQPTTQIWGDGDDSNGIPPGYASDPMGLPMGAVIPLRNDVNLPRNPAEILYDARDRVTASKALVVTRALWARDTGPVLAEAVEVSATIDHGTHYIAPVGEDVDAYDMFEHVGLAVMADQDNTVVTIDKDGPGGAAPVTVTLNRGESYFVNGGVMQGAEVTSTKPVQAHLLTGDVGAYYETRWYTLFPVGDWYSRYVTPVGSAANGQACFVFLYNPGPGAITITATSRVGTESITVPAGEAYRWQVPQNSGAMFSSTGGEPFSAIAAAGAHPYANNAYDWGFSLVPQDALSPTAVVGWGPGSSDMTRNGSPVFVSPAKATRIYVDYGGDGQGPLTDPNGGKYDVHYDLAALESKTILDPDGDQTAMRIYTTDGALFSAAWGQDPDTARPGNPYLDMGSTVLPLPEPKLVKTARIVNDADPAGPSLGDTIEYRIAIDNKGLLPLGNTLVLDTLPPQLDYVAGSTTLDGEPLPDDTAGSTLFPLDETGYTIPIILRAGSSVFTYRTTITGTGSIVNRGAAPQYEIYDQTEADVLPPSGSNPSQVRFVDEHGNDVTVYPEGDDIYLWFKDLDANRDPGAVETITLIIRNETTGDYESITLTETGPDTGVFTTTAPVPSSPSSGLGPEDGTLYARAGDDLAVYYVDPLYGDSCSDTATLSVPSETKVLYLTDANGGGAPPEPAVQYKRQITFANSAYETLQNFPVLVHLTEDNFDFSKANSDGSDIRFYDADGVTPLSYEIESWDALGWEAHIWVRVPQIDKTDTDSIWMHYGDASRTDAQTPAAVWSDNFRAVWHMDETTGTVNDSTSNNLDGIPNANVVLDATGKVDGADQYPDGVHGYTSLPSGQIVPARNPFTFESWIYLAPNSNYDRIFAQTLANYHCQVIRHGNIIQVGRNYSGASYDCPLTKAAAVPGSGNWFHFAWVFDGSSDALFVNGMPATSANQTHVGATIAATEQTKIGARDSSSFPFGGMLDEMRVSTTARSANWIKAQYASMNGTFATLGAEQSFIPAPPMLRKRKITFDNSTRNEDLADFPVLVHLTGANFDFTKAKSDGSDLRFYDADGTTPLSHEIESWDVSAQQAHIWVRVPKIDRNSNTDSIWMHYGNPALADVQKPADVWSDNFRAVWHMDETAGAAVADSTGNGWNGIATAVARDTAGKVDGADEYADNAYTTVAKPGAIISATSPFTFETWVNVGAADAYDRIFTQDTPSGQLQIVLDSGRLHVARYDGTADYGIVKGAAPVTSGTWTHFAWVFDGSADTLYINGTPASTTTTFGSTALGDTYNYIGALDKSKNYFDGKLDEMRLAATARSAAWISAQYASMNGAFATLGAEESAPLEINYAQGATGDAMDRIDPVATADTTTACTVVLDGSAAGTYRQQLTFNNASRSEDLLNFPVLVHLTADNFNFKKARSDGRNIRFFDADGTTPLAYEIESWDADAQQAHIWVKVPKIDRNSNTDSIWMEYGDPALTDAQTPAAVWSSNFRAVWHMDERSGTQVADSTSYARHGVATETLMRDLIGPVNGCDGYVDGVAYTTLPTGAIIPANSTAFTFESWVWVGKTEDYDRLFTQTVDNRDYQVVWVNNRLEVVLYDSSYNRNQPKAAAALPSKTWVHFAWVHSGSTETLYINGVAATASPSSGWYAGVGQGNFIGGHNTTDRHFDGQIDEMRIASVARSAHWISAQYASMTGTLVTYGDAQLISAQNLPRAAFTQAPVFCKDFVMPAAGALSARVFVAAMDGAMAVNPAIYGTLRHGTTQLADLGAPTATFIGFGTGGEAIYRLDWSAVLDTGTTIPAGQAVTIEIATADNSPFAVIYDSAAYPSRVSLPAETVIEVDSLAIYDAPYPGGSPVGAAVAGSTVYVRAVVSDPFGAYDITSLGLAIPAAGVDVTLGDDAVVAATPCTKTYEYAWTPAAEGSYSVAVTAHEGTEGITDVAATRLDVTFLDFGTPSITEFTITDNGSATNIYDPDQTVYIRVTDLDQNTDPNTPDTITVTVTTSTGDTETITLTETGSNTGIFTAEVPASSTNAGADEDGTLHAPPGTVLDVVYVDQYDPTDTSSDTAIVTQPSGTSGFSVRKRRADGSTSPVMIGDTVVYRVRVSNTGTTTLDPISLTDTYPAALRFISASPAADSHNATQRLVTWTNIGPLAVGGYREFELAFEALSAAPAAVNSATATHAGTPRSDSAVVEIVNAGHTVAKTLLSTKNPVSYGEYVEYRIVVANTGSTRITEIPLEDTFSAAYLAYVPESATIEPDGIGAGMLFWENIAAPDGLAVGGAITNDLVFQVIGAGSPIVNTVAADYSVDEYGSPVPPARDADTNLVSTAGLISGHVWNDLDRNQAGDAGEPRLPGVEIRLFDAAGELVATTTTLGTNGYYEFPNLPDGTYTVVETDPPGFGSTGDVQGANDNRITVTIDTGSVHANQDFFDYRLPLGQQASIGGTVWNDTNRDGVVDDGERGIPGVTIALYRDVNNNGAHDAEDELVRYALTDLDGGYAFGALEAGNYIVVETDPPGYISTGDISAPNDNQIPVSVNAGDKVTGQDFLDARIQRLYGYAYYDADESLTRNEGDGVCSGMVVQVWQNHVFVAATIADDEASTSSSICCREPTRSASWATSMP
jgi:uncharacterized repeat protein (TIGR01451 family)